MNEKMTMAQEIDWSEIDALLYAEQLIHAARRYWEMTGNGLNLSLGAVSERNGLLRKQFPERFRTKEQLDAEAYEQALIRLEAIPAKIVVIEGSWDADSRGWFIILSAITEEPSSQHPRYTAHGLCQVRGWDGIVERATAWGTELGRRVGASFFLTCTDTSHIDDRIHWWDTQ